MEFNFEKDCHGDALPVAFLQKHTHPIKKQGIIRGIPPLVWLITNGIRIKKFCYLERIKKYIEKLKI